MANLLFNTPMQQHTKEQSRRLFYIIQGEAPNNLDAIRGKINTEDVQEDAEKDHQSEDERK